MYSLLPVARRADLGAKEPIQDGNDSHGEQDAQDDGNGGLRQTGHIADGGEHGALGKNGRIGLAHDAQVDGPQTDLRKDSGEDCGNLKDGGQNARDGTRDGAGAHTGQHGEQRVDVVIDDEHSADAAAEGKAAVAGHIGNVEQAERDKHAKHHNAPEDALRNGALQCNEHASYLLG